MWAREARVCVVDEVRWDDGDRLILCGEVFCTCFEGRCKYVGDFGGVLYMGELVSHVCCGD